MGPNGNIKYVISSLRQQMMAYDLRLQEKAEHGGLRRRGARLACWPMTAMSDIWHSGERGRCFGLRLFSDAGADSRAGHAGAIAGPPKPSGGNREDRPVCL